MSDRNPFKNFEKKEEPKVELKKEEAVQVIEEAKTEPIKESALEPTAQSRTSDPLVILSQTDAYIHERMKSQPKTLVEVLDAPSDGTIRHRLALPPELEAMKDRYTFRWVFKAKRAIDEACDQRGWTLVNKLFFPDVPNHHFTANGSIERGDNILSFMPNKKAETIRKILQNRSNEILSATFAKHQDNPNFYKPSDNEDENVTMI